MNLSIMSASDREPVVINCTDQERREIYRMLDIRRKLASGQAYIKLRKFNPGPPLGNFPEGTKGRSVDIHLTINDWRICVAQHYVLPDGTDHTEPDPKMIHIDDLILNQLKTLKS